MKAQLINVIAGIWIIAAPYLFGFNKTAADVNHIIGPLVVLFSFIALWEVNRSARLLNIITGICLLLSPWVFHFSPPFAFTINTATGAVVMVCSLFKGKINHQYGGGWLSLFRKSPPHLQMTDERTVN